MSCIVRGHRLEYRGRIERRRSNLSVRRRARRSQPQGTNEDRATKFHGIASLRVDWLTTANELRFARAPRNLEHITQARRPRESSAPFAC
jgi:hypothetical protein